MDAEDLSVADVWGDRLGLDKAGMKIVHAEYVRRTPPPPPPPPAPVADAGGGSYYGGGGGGGSSGGGFSAPAYTPSAAAQDQMFRRDLDTRIRTNTFGR